MSRSRQQEENRLRALLHNPLPADPVEAVREESIRKAAAPRRLFDGRLILTESTSLAELLSAVSERTRSLDVRELCGRLIEMAAEFGES